MALVMGGAEKDEKTAALGGLVGGLSLGILIILSHLAIFSRVDIVGDSDMPMLAIINDISPVLAILHGFRSVWNDLQYGCRHVLCIWSTFYKSRNEELQSVCFYHVSSRFWVKLLRLQKPCRSFLSVYRLFRINSCGCVDLHFIQSAEKGKTIINTKERGSLREGAAFLLLILRSYKFQCFLRSKEFEVDFFFCYSHFMQCRNDSFHEWSWSADVYVAAFRHMLL